MENNKNLPPQAILMQMINGKHISRCVSLMAELGISDLLLEGAKSIKHLAEKTDSKEDPLNRVLRLMTRLGIYTEVKEGFYENNFLSELLGSQHPHSVKKYAQWMGTGFHWNVTRDLDYSVKTGIPSILKDTDKSNPFEVLLEHPEAQGVFQDAMTGMSTAEGYLVAEAYDWSAHQKIIDVGGGHGTLAKIIAEQTPNSKVSIFDIPEVIEQTKKIVEQTGLTNLTAVPGSFFESIPTPVELIIMKYIIHDWNDEKSIEILNNCKSALSENGKILLCEMMITNGPESIPAQIFDIEMLIGPGGKERTQKQFEELFEKAGLRLIRIIDTKSPLKLIEAESTN